MNVLQRKHGNRVILFFIFLFSLSLFLTSAASASVDIANQTGTVVVTTPDGKVTIIEPGQTAPSFPDGSIVEITTGSADISASGGTAAEITINNTTIKLGSGAQVKVAVALATSDVNIQIVSGNVQMIKPDGTTLNLQAGDSNMVPSTAPSAISLDKAPGADAAQSIGREQDVEEGKLGGY